MIGFGARSRPSFGFLNVCHEPTLSATAVDTFPVGISVELLFLRTNAWAWHLKVRLRWWRLQL